MSDITELNEDDDKLACFYDMQEGDLDSLEARPLFQQINNLQERYFDMEELGTGGMKKVFKAYDEKAERFVAVARPSRKLDHEYVERFLYEARLTAALHHPNIIKVHDLGLDEKSAPYFVMELKEGITLSDLITAGKTSIDDLLTVFLKICDAMSYAHSKNIVHLDLKPDNIQIGSHGEVLVCDWGLAKSLKSNDEGLDANGKTDSTSTHPYITLDGNVKGTPGFMSPEQIDKSKGLNQSSDIYSLGALLFFIINGHAPAEGEVSDVITKTIKGNLLPFSTKVSKALQAITLKALSINSKERYSTVSELITDIQLYRQGFATAAENASIFQLLNLLIKRLQRIFAVSLLFLAVIITSSLSFLKQLKDREKMALEERDKAQNALEKFIEEKKRNDALLNSASAKAIKKARAFFDKKIFTPISTHPRSFLNTAAELKGTAAANPNHSRLWLALGNFYFKIQKFNEALRYYEKTTEANQALIKLAEKYSQLLEENNCLSADNLHSLIQEFQGSEYSRSKFATDLIHYFFAKEKKSNLRGKVLHAVLETWNPEWQKQIFKFHKRANSNLTIGGPGLKNFLPINMRMGRGNILNMLGITHLKIIGSDLKGLKQLNGLNLISIDIAESNITSLDGLKDLKTVTELIVRKSQFTDLSSLPEKIKIIQLDTPVARR